MKWDLKTKEHAWALWLLIQDTPKVGPAKIKSLYDKTGSLEGIIEYIESYPSPPDWMHKISLQIEKADLSKYEQIITQTIKCGAKICTLEDANYPKNLKKSSSPPPVIFYKGSLDELSENALAVVGTLAPTELGIKRTEKFVLNCARNNIQVVSGLARGIDTAAHQSALKYKIKTYAVIGHGIDYYYPPENKQLFEKIEENGAVITQFVVGTKPAKWTFPARNETMCTLSAGTVIIEAHEKCGSLIQAKYSFQHNRRVFLLNSNIEKDTGWAKSLIEKGALVVKDFNDVLSEMSKINISFKPREQLNQASFAFKTSESNPRKAILFDLDGVLYDSFSLMKDVYCDIVKEIKGEITENDRCIINAFVNNAPTFVLKKIGVDPERGHSLYKKRYLEKIQNGISFFPGIHETLTSLKENGCLLGVVTSQPLSRFKAIISHAPFKDVFDTTVTWNDIPRSRQKPAPDGILKALDTLNVEPSNAVYVGDDVKDIEAAKNAQAHSVAALWGALNKKSLLDSKPDFIAYKPENILEMNF